MRDLENILAKAVNVARQFGATRLLLFGSALTNPATARDLDRVRGCSGLEAFRVGRRTGRFAARVPLDLVPLDTPTPFSRLIEKRSRVRL